MDEEVKKDTSESDSKLALGVPTIWKRQNIYLPTSIDYEKIGCVLDQNPRNWIMLEDDNTEKIISKMGEMGIERGLVFS